MFRQSAGWVAGRGPLPTTVSAVLSYYAHSGVFDLGSLRLKRRVDDETEAMIDDAFAAVEAELAAAFERDAVDFDYDTKLILPAELTLGYCYRTLEDEDRIAEAEALTRLAIEALIDGDMRDARNDAEYGDFEVDFPTDETDRERIAAIAQETLQERVEAAFDDFDDAVADLYDWAVDVSEAHQAEDEFFRDLMADAADGDSDAASEVRSAYKHAAFDEPPEIFDEGELDLPYLKTQYDRVGVIYDGMCRMYEAAGFPIAAAFSKSIVLAIVGAQLWLDDIDDYRVDRREGQLTPVTAEYLLADDEATAYRSVVDISERYLDLAREHATDADSTLTGIATEYIYHSGDPGVLPGSR
jgi:hypothetical protein